MIKNILILIILHLALILLITNKELVKYLSIKTKKSSIFGLHLEIDITETILSDLVQKNFEFNSTFLDGIVLLIEEYIEEKKVTSCLVSVKFSGNFNYFGNDLKNLEVNSTQTIPIQIIHCCPFVKKKAREQIKFELKKQLFFILELYTGKYDLKKIVIWAHEYPAEVQTVKNKSF